MIKFGKGTDPANHIDCYTGVNLYIGHYCSIGSGLKILSGTHPCIKFPKVVSQYPFKEQWGVDYPPSEGDGHVIIGNDVWVATDVSILEGVRIGNGAILGAKAVITKDVPDYAFVAGNPARVKHYRFDKLTILSLLSIAWWDWPKQAIVEAMPYMNDADKFVEKYYI